MKIAFVLTQSLESPGGLSRFGPLARGLVGLGHSVELFALHPDFNNLKQRAYCDRGVQVAYVSQMHVQKSSTRKTYYSPGRLMVVALAATLRLAQALYHSEAEVIQVCKAHPMNTLAARLARRGRPLYFDCDDYEAQVNHFGAGWQRRLVSFFEDSIVRDAAALTVNTRFLLHRFVDLGFPLEKILLVPNGVERDRFAGPFNPPALRQRLGIAQDAPLVVYTGTLGIQSHPVDLILRGFPQVLASLPAAQLLMVGSGEDYDALQNLAVSLGIAHRVIFTGHVPGDEVPHYLAAADVSVDPIHDDDIARSRSPLKIYESLAVGTPVVSSPVGDRELLLGTGRYGLLVEPGSSQALADGLIRILSGAILRQELRSNAIQDREQWYWDGLVQTFSRVYTLSS